VSADSPSARTTPSLGLRLSRGLALLTILGLGLLCGAIYLALALTLSQRQTQTLDQKQQAVQQLLAEGRSGAQRDEQLRDLLAGHSELALSLHDAQGRLLFSHRPAGETEPPPAGKTRHFAAAPPAGEAVPLQARLRLDTRADAALLQRVAWILALAALGGAAAVSAGTYALVRRGLAPLHRLRAQTELLGGHDLEQRLDGRGQPSELQPLITQFNAHVAHELNTPLATLISSCELALRRRRDDAELQDLLGSNLEELHRLAGIVADMLFLSHADRGRAARREPLASVAALAAEVLDFHEAALLEAGLRAEVAGDASAALDAGLLRRALSNLLGNATRYAQPGSVLRIAIEPLEDARWLRLSVLNEGPEIAPVHLPRLFDRFYRADPARAQADRNHGLGLAIVAAIARMHGGQPFAESALGRTRIGLLLPRMTQA
jgi:two-component system heavy metal sensor histidine kinase CusS